MDKLSTQCVIAGGGPAGMMCGYLLARAGIDVIVLEKHKDFLRDFRGDTIHPSTLELMHELGLLEKFLKLPHTEIRYAKIDIGKETFTVGDFSQLATQCKFLGLMPQWDFLDFLAAEARRFPTFHLAMNTEVTEILARGSRIAGVRVKTPEGSGDLLARLVIGADGRHSVVRGKAKLKVKNLGAPFDVLWMRLPFHAGDPVDLIARVSGGLFFVMIYRGDYWQCALGIPKGGFEQIKADGISGFRARLRSIAGFARDRVETIESFDQVKLLTVTVDRLEQWARPGLICIGDAAHAMSPVGGVGINLAIQDAVAAANVLAPILPRRTPHLSELLKIQKRRMFPTRVVQGFQVAAQNNVVAPTLRATGTLRPPLIVRLLNRFPALRRWPAQFIGVGVRPEHIRTPLVSPDDSAPS